MEACQRACPVEVCVPDPARREDEAVLLALARRLHPERAFPSLLPAGLSRFSKRP
jgi:hypothetical protein